MNKRIFAAAAITLLSAPALHAAGLAVQPARVRGVVPVSGPMRGITGGLRSSFSLSPLQNMNFGRTPGLRAAPAPGSQAAPGLEAFSPAPELSPAVEAAMTQRPSATEARGAQEALVLLENDPSVATILKEGSSGDLPATSAALGRLADGSRFLPGTESEAPATVAAISDSGPYLRPASEVWTVGDKTYASTTLLVKAAERGEIKSGATALHQSRMLAFSAPGWKERAKDAAGVAVAAGAIGAFFGGVLSAGLVVVAAMSELMTLALYGHPTPMGPALVWAPIGLGWFFAAAIGAVVGWKDSNKFEGFTNSRSGEIENFRGVWVFRPKGDPTPVDLARHRDAPAYRAPITAQLTRWFDPFLGIASAAAMGVAAYLVPLGPLLLGSAAAAKLWPGKDAGTAGALLGGVYGYAAAALFYFLGLAAGFWAAVFAAVYVGASLGFLVIPMIRRERWIAKDLAEKAPWWQK